VFCQIHIKCPIWYSKLSDEQQKSLQNVENDIIDVDCWSKEVESCIMDIGGLSSQDAQDIYQWLKKEQVIFFHFHS
jgi:hypothetical protein